jgi:hypothetical protein
MNNPRCPVDCKLKSIWVTLTHKTRRENILLSNYVLRFTWLIPSFTVELYLHLKSLLLTS